MPTAFTPSLALDLGPSVTLGAYSASILMPTIFAPPPPLSRVRLSDLDIDLVLPKTIRGPRYIHMPRLVLISAAVWPNMHAVTET